MLNSKTIGAGKPVLMLHGITLDLHHMSDIMEPAFDGLDGWCRVYVDLPGHGLSPAQDHIQSQDDVLTEITAFADAQFGDTPFAVAGYSRGSYLAQGIAQLMPERLTGAALMAPGGNPNSDPARLPKHRVLKADAALRAELPQNELWAFDNLTVVQTRELVEKRRRIIFPARAQHDAEQEARVLARFDLSCLADARASVFDQPSLIVAGRQDSVSGYLDAIDLLPQFPRASLAVLDAAGHPLAWERPEIFAALIRDWLIRMETT